MYGVVGEMEEKRPIFLLADEANGLIGEPVREIFTRFLLYAIRVFVGAMVATCVGATSFVACDIDIESISFWVLGHVPLADMAGGVAHFFEGTTDSEVVVLDVQRILDRNEFAVNKK